MLSIFWHDLNFYYHEFYVTIKNNNEIEYYKVKSILS